MSDLPEELRVWIGRSATRSERVSDRLIDRFRVTLAGHLAPGAVPPGFFWTLAPDAEEPAQLGRDGHPRTGLHLPALPYPRRMWAGGEIAFHGEIAPGDTVDKTSTVESIRLKTGRTGPLGFVAVRHHYRAGERLLIDERQDIVYREDPAPGAIAAPPPQAEPWEGATVCEVLADPVMLFRYSALTFNGHRIHYDHPYATGVEGYAGLVVHGPLQATLMLNLATEMAGALPRRFSYRGLSPLTCGAPFRIEGRTEGNGRLTLRTVSAAGVTTMQAQAEAWDGYPGAASSR